MLIYVAGSGAMGCTFGYHIQKNTDNEVILLDYWPDHIDNINSNGLEVTGQVEGKVEIKAMKPEEATEKADLIIVMTKSMQLENMVKAVQPLIDENTQLLCLLNGMGHEEILKNYVNLDQINMGVTVWAAGINGPGSVNVSGVGSIDIQNIGGNDEAGQRIAEMMDEAGLHVRYNSDVMKAIWRKAMVNGSMNAIAALLECKVGEFTNTDIQPEVTKELISEFVEVGAAEGVDFDENEMLEYIRETNKKVAGHYPSMYQDLITHNRKTEVDYINGAVVAKGKKHKIPTPYNELITQLVHAKEELREAK